jgi:hypothetical protein
MFTCCVTEALLNELREDFEEVSFNRMTIKRRVNDVAKYVKAQIFDIIKLACLLRDLRLSWR